MTRHNRLVAALSTALAASALVLAPVAAANAQNADTQLFKTKTQCVYTQNQLHKLGYHIDYACYPSAGYWVLVYEV